MVSRWERSRVQTDEELAAGMQRGDRACLATLVERHHSLLIGYLYRLSAGDRVLAEDLVQESFLRVLCSIDLYQYPRPFKPWLYRIATNLARDHFKRAETRYAVALPEDDQFPLTGDSAMEMDLTLEADTRQLVQVMRSLPVHQREVVLLRYVEELSLAEIAETLDIPLGTVKSRLSLGLGRLREMLVEQEEK